MHWIKPGLVGAALYLLVGLQMVTMVEVSMRCERASADRSTRLPLLMAAAWPALVWTVVWHDWPRCPAPPAPGNRKAAR